MNEPTYTLLTGHTLDVLRRLPSESVSSVVTSPPYFGQRAYHGEQKTIWGGDSTCEHQWQPYASSGLLHENRNFKRGTQDEVSGSGPLVAVRDEADSPVDVCAVCGAMRCPLGLELTPQDYINHLVEVFREVRRVLVPWGVLLVNVGDSYNAGRDGGHAGGKNSGFQQVDDRYQQRSGVNVPDLKPADLIGVPWLLAFALRDDGWWLRSDMIWSKGQSGQGMIEDRVAEACRAAGLDDTTTSAVLAQFEPYVGNCMPESVSSWRWVQHKVKQEDGTYIDCPGCPQCLPNNGLVLRYGSWRPTKSHEYCLLLAKSDRYWMDDIAMRETQVTDEETFYKKRNKNERNIVKEYGEVGYARTKVGFDKMEYSGTGRNLRSVLAVPTTSFRAAHFATMSRHLAELLVRMVTPKAGICSQCGRPWVRVIDKQRAVSKDCPKTQSAHKARGGTGKVTGTVGQSGGGRIDGYATTLGWRPSCTCTIDCPSCLGSGVDTQGWTAIEYLSCKKCDGTGKVEPVSATILDPFSGAGTTGVYALRNNCNYIGIDIAQEYNDMAAARMAADISERTKPVCTKKNGNSIPVNMNQLSLLGD